MMKSLKTNTKGFSLVELMVVVAIIGILATLAIPSVQKYMAKARQAEAKTTLSALFTSEKAFFAEYNTYSATFSFIGFDPEGVFRYDAGFTGGVTNEASYGYSSNSTSPNTIMGVCEVKSTSAPTKACQYTAEATTIPAAVLTNTNFTAMANAKIYKGAEDTWSINESKSLKNDKPGVN